MLRYRAADDTRTDYYYIVHAVAPYLIDSQTLNILSQVCAKVHLALHPFIRFEASSRRVSLRNNFIFRLIL